MIMLALAPPSIAVVSFDHRCATAIPHVVTGRPGSSPHRSSSKQASNARRQQTASIEIPIASDARHRHTSRGFLLWSFAYAGPRCPPRHHHGAGIRKPSHKLPVRKTARDHHGLRTGNASRFWQATAWARTLPCLGLRVYHLTPRHLSNMIEIRQTERRDAYRTRSAPPEQTKTDTMEIERKSSKINEPIRYPVAHNGLVAGSSPAAHIGKSPALDF
jgi:hypothetical protein